VTQLISEEPIMNSHVITGTCGLLLGTYLLGAQIPQPDGGPVQPGTLPKQWMTGGPRCMEVPDWQVHEYNEDFYILRESGCTHYEKPFMYLIFGRDRALLEDTGAGTADTQAIVRNVIGKWLKRKGRESIPLVVMHSHGHGDHVAGDAQFQNRAGIEFIPATVAAVKGAFGIHNWPEGPGFLDLGDRPIDVLAVPGHQEAAVALYDRETGILLTGDNLYPGRLYVSDWAEFEKSTQRLVDFTQSKVVTHILGCHIEEMNRPYREYPIGSIYQPDEHVLELSRGTLLELNQAIHEHRAKPARLAYRDFTIWPMSPEVQEEMRKTREQTEQMQRKNQWAQPN
jgi:hydroxyacylglutathione hydrolase